MYGYYLTAKAKAQREGGGVGRVELNKEGMEALRVNQKTVWRKLGPQHPVRYGMAGDFKVVTPENSTKDILENCVVAKNGMRYVFTGEGVHETPIPPN